MEFLDEAAKSDKPFFINVNFMKNHQPNLPAPEFEHKSISKSKYADAVVELDTRVGNLLKKLDELGLADNTRRVLHGRQRRLAGRLSGRRLHAVPRHQGHGARGRQSRSLDGALARQGRAPASKNDDILGGLDLMATFASIAGVEAAEERPRRQADHLRQLRHDARAGRARAKSARNAWFYFTEDELSPGRGARRQLQVRVQPSRRRRRAHGRSGGRHQSRLEGRRASTSPPCLRCSTCWQIRRSATTSS